jgi:NADH-quinone oxidoreductase subunit G
VPGGEAAALGSLADGIDTGETGRTAARALSQPGAVILAGERLAEVPGALAAAARLASQTGAELAWIPRRAGERGAIDAGALPTLLPGGRRSPTPGRRGPGVGVAAAPADPAAPPDPRRRGAGDRAPCGGRSGSGRPARHRPRWRAAAPVHHQPGAAGHAVTDR